MFEYTLSILNRRSGVQEAPISIESWTCTRCGGYRPIDRRQFHAKLLTNLMLRHAADTLYVTRKTRITNVRIEPDSELGG